jgi:ferric-dicitrate binding protein FerR (iron transport regulator)
MPLSRPSYLPLAGVIAASLLVSPGAMGAEAIGDAVGVTPAVVGTVSGELGVNVPVYRDETVRTGPTGVLEIKFLDQTHLALGSSSSVKLDRFVYSGGQASDVVLGLSKGVFRFATGVSAKKAYWIQTPLAGIGVRGTNFTAEIGATFERYTIWEGAIEVCPRQQGLSIDQERKRQNCPVLRRPGETLTVMSSGSTRRGGPPVTLSLSCAETGAGAQLCGHYGGGPTRRNGQNRPGFNFPPFAPPPQKRGEGNGAGPAQ